MAEIPAPMQTTRRCRVGVRIGLRYIGIHVGGSGWPYRVGGSGVGPLAWSGSPSGWIVGSEASMLEEVEGAPKFMMGKK